MRLRTSFTVFCALLVGGCAIPAEPRLGSNHPASPLASEAPASQMSMTLAPEDPTVSGTGEVPGDHMPMKPGEVMDHSRMNHEGHDMSSMPRGAGGSAATRPTSATRTAAPFTCVMHPEVISNTLGKCPKCGMKLVPGKK